MKKLLDNQTPTFLTCETKLFLLNNSLINNKNNRIIIYMYIYYFYNLSKL